MKMQLLFSLLMKTFRFPNYAPPGTQPVSRYLYYIPYL
jgi:hypothetical protein